MRLWPGNQPIRISAWTGSSLPPISCGVGTGQIYAAGQQPPLPGSLTFEFGGGQLMAVLVPTCAQAADPAVLTPPAAQADGPAWPVRPVIRLPGRGAAAGRVPLRHFGSLHSIADAATGGTPLTQSGLGQALAAVGIRPSEPAVRAADMTAPAATRLGRVFSMTRVFPGSGVS